MLSRVEGWERMVRVVSSNRNLLFKSALFRVIGFFRHCYPFSVASERYCYDEGNLVT